MIRRCTERIMARIGRPPERALTLSDGERDELERIGRSRSARHSLVRRAQIVLASARGEPNTAIAERLGVSNPTICHWRKKWFEQGIVGLYGESRPGRPRTHDEETVAQLLRTVLDTKPIQGTHWTVRSAAAVTGPVEEHGRAHARALRGAAASHQKLQALHRSAVRRQGEGYRRALPQPA